MNNKTNLALVTFVAALFAATAIVITTTISNANAIAGGTGTTTTVKVQAGGGNATNMLAAFVPQQVQVSVGQSVTWDNPSSVAEPHTVTFVLNNKTMTAPDVPFAVRSSTQFMPLPPWANSQPSMMPGKNGMNIVIVSNARGYYPTLIDSSGNAKVSGPNGNFTITGNEQYVNSGWLLPKGQQQLYPGSSNTFTVSFQKAGTYNYFCEIHPWMAGVVTVK
jgi:plastocyanin